MAPKISLTAHLDKEKKSRKTQLTKEVLYNFEWQALRTSLDFSEAGYQNSLALVTQYIETADDRINRIWRALNLITATRMGFSGLIRMCKDPAKLKELQIRDKILENYREKLSESYKALKEKFKLISDSEYDQLKDLKEASLEDLSRVYSSLTFRFENSSQSAARPELINYLNLMKTVIFNHRNQAEQNFIVEEVNKKLKGLRKSRKAKVLDWTKI